MKRVLTYSVNDQSGMVLLAVIMFLLGLTAMAVIAIRTGTTELHEAGNDKCHKIAFFAADGACDMTTELIGQNVEARGFLANSYGKTNVTSLNFFSNTEDAVPANNIPSATNHDIEVPNMGDNGIVYLRVYGNTKLSTGSALQIAAGYDGMGKGLAGGGAQIVYEIRSRATGPCSGIARIWWRWLHLI